MGLKKEEKRLSKRKQLAKTFLGVFLAIFIFGFVLNFININQQQPSSVTGQQVLDFKSDVILTWQEGTLDIVVARWLFFILGVIFLYSMLGLFFGGMNGFIKFVVGLILSFLFTGYIVPGDLLAVMTTYGAAGITLIAIIPPLLLIAFAASILTERKMGAGGVIMQRFLWLFYFLFMIYTVFRFWGTSQGGVDISNPVLLILLVVTFISFAAFIWNKLYLKFIANTITNFYKTKIKPTISKEKAEGMSELAEKNRKQAIKDMDEILGG